MIKGCFGYLSPKVAEKLIRNQEEIYQLGQVNNVRRLDKQNALVRRLVRKTQDGTLGTPTSGGDDVADDDEESDDQIIFGDTNNTYTITEQAERAAAKVAPGILPYVLAAALGGGGLGAAMMALPALLKTPEPPKVIVAGQGDDTDTMYDLQFRED